MKRHISLVPLSQDHHDGLLLAIRLQQREKALPRLWSHDPSWQAGFVVEFFETHLAQHFEIEETVVFPIYRSIFKNNSLVNQLQEEHDRMKNYITFFRKPDEPMLLEKLREFGELLESHIRCEEREFFPLCEESIPETELKKIQEAILHHKNTEKGH